MALMPMYPGQPNSPQTELAENIDETQTTIPLLDASVLPPGPNLVVIGSGEHAETVLYESIDGDNLINCTRGFQGVASSWQAGQKVARNFTAYDYDALRQNLESHGSEHNHDGADPIPDLVQLRELGLGIDVDPRTTENLDLEVQPGWVSTTPETIGIPPFRGYGVVRIDRRNGNRVAQTYYHLSGAMETTIFTRILGETGWTDWVQMLHTGNTGSIVTEDYEVGTWTPEFITTENPIEEIEYSGSTSGTYVRIGGLIYIRLSIQTNRLVKGSASGALRIAGLPFPYSPGGTLRFGGLSIARATGFSSDANERYPYWRATIIPNSTEIAILENNPDTTPIEIRESTLRDHTSSSYNFIAISGSYYTTAV